MGEGEGGKRKKMGGGEIERGGGGKNKFSKGLNLGQKSIFSPFFRNCTN